MSAERRVLIVLTSVDKYPDGSPTGWYAPEAIHPYNIFTKAGFVVEFASITGSATCDPGSLGQNDADVDAFVADEALYAKTKTTAKKVDDCIAEDYCCVFFAGGFGTMWDFVDSASCQKLIEGCVKDEKKVVAAVCHGPIVFAKSVDSEGKPLLAGKEVTAFTNAEENAVSKYDVVSAPSGPGSCEDVLCKLGAKFVDGGVFKPQVCTAGNVFTGQNPPSAAPLADAIVKYLS